MKYVIKNCPAYDYTINECRNEFTEHICCWMNEDCIMKQIIQRANDCLAPEIIDLLEIEEVE